MAKKQKGSKKVAASLAEAGKPMDPRFAAAHEDPRFQRFPAARKSVAIDERFKGIFENPDFETLSTVDKRGRKVKKTKTKDDMRKYYRLKDGGEDAEAAAAPASLGEAEPAAGKAADMSLSKKQKNAQQAAAEEAKRRQADTGATSSGSSDEESAEENDAAAAAEKRWAYLRGVGQPSDASDSSSEEEEEADVEAEEEAAIAEAEAQWGIGAMAANPRERIPDGSETCRLAAVDLDWEHIRAVDIFAALRSFLPSSGRIESVTVYPSDYGLQRMKEEAEAGPQGIYRPIAADRKARGSKQQGRNAARRGADDLEGEHDEEKSESDVDSCGSEDGSESDAAEEETSEQEADGRGRRDPQSDSESAEDEVDKERLRMYERSKLRYYYAIIEFNDVATASRVYQECDGLEFQQSTCKFDLRFVPDEQSFEGREVREVARELPEDYQAPNFQTQALQHTNPKLTWDAEDADRKRTLSRRLTTQELRDDDFKAYLASDSESSEDEAAAQAQREKFRGLLLGDGGSGDTRKGTKGWGGQDAGDEDADSEEEGAVVARRRKDEDMEMELTFQGGLENLGQRLLAKQQAKAAKQSETVWQAYERRRREKKAAAKALGRKQVDSDEEFSDPDVASDSEDEGGRGTDPFFQHDDDPFNDPFFQDDAAVQQPQQPVQKGKKGSKKDKRKGGQQQDAEEAAAEARRQAELELLLMDEGALHRPAPAATGWDAKPANLSKKERARLKKAKRLQERQAGSDDEDLAVNGGQDNFRADLADPRFQALYTSDQFALDPTDPRYKATETTSAIQKARARRHDADAADATPQPAKPASSSGKEPSLRALVANLKRKVASGSNGTADAQMPVNPSAAKQPKKKKRRVEGTG